MGRSSANCPRKRTRLVSGCASCRDKHLKCDTDLPVCQQCRIAGILCDRTTKLRFKHELGSGPGLNHGFPADQDWLDVCETLHYYDETPEIVEYYRHISSDLNLARGSFVNFVQGDRPRLESRATDQSFGCDLAGRPPYDQSESTVQAAERIGPNTDAGTSRPVTAHVATTPAFKNVLSISDGSPASLPSRSNYVRHSTYQFDYFEPFADREASLMRNFIENVALWLDIVDRDRNFEVEVPHRALYNTMLRYAIFSFSSRHINRHTPDIFPTEALDYRNKALQLLIPQLSGPVEDLTEDHLASIIILRIDEEMEFDDNQSHLTGATSILNSVAPFGSSGGLGEACAWICLRQDIYVSITTQTPLRTTLDNLHNSSWIRKDDDVSWASKAVLLLADILGFAFAEHSAHRTSKLEHLSDQLDNWHRDKSSSFRPIKFVQRSKERGSRLPTIWMLSPCHVFGVQFYHIARIILLLSLEQEKNPNVGFQDYHAGRKREKILREHLLNVVGLATSNPKAENTLFQARHALAVWGGVLRHPLDQEAAAEFLKSMQNRTGWNVSKTLDSLHHLWHEDSD